ncbi:MAG: hypothetical protein ABIH03_14930 [Pseudomonadota bacterium]
MTTALPQARMAAASQRVAVRLLRDAAVRGGENIDQAFVLISPKLVRLFDNLLPEKHPRLRDFQFTDDGQEIVVYAAIIGPVESGTPSLWQAGVAPCLFPSATGRP